MAGRNEDEVGKDGLTEVCGGTIMILCDSSVLHLSCCSQSDLMYDS